MEFVEGSPLSSMIPMTWQQALPIFVQILDSLEYAHSMGVLHRDMKPDNIMVSPHGEVKVMDFGISHVLGQARQTREKTIVGTLEYIPPEQIANKPIGAWSDIYSLGALLFEMISGRVPYQAESEFALLQCHLQSPIPDLRQFARDVPAFLADSVSKALAKNPEERFASCKAWADLLRQSAPEVFGQALTRTVTEKEIDRCIRRVDALVGGDQIDLAYTVIERAQQNYPRQTRLTECAKRVTEQRNTASRASENDQKSVFVRTTLDRLAELESSGNFAAALTYLSEAIAKEPRIPALQVAAAYLRKK
jgi:serine/threonine protein kinase